MARTKEGDNELLGIMVEFECFFYEMPRVAGKGPRRFRRETLKNFIPFFFPSRFQVMCRLPC